MLTDGDYYWITPKEDSDLSSEWMIGRATSQRETGDAWFFLSGNEVEKFEGEFLIGPKVIGPDETAGIEMMGLRVADSPSLNPLAETIRDKFAMAALTGLYADGSATTDLTPAEVSADAYRIADAMMKAREGK